MCGTAPDTPYQGDATWVWLLEASSLDCLAGGTPVPNKPPKPPDDLLLACVETGWQATYMHLATVWVSRGQLVERGLALGTIDSTGNSTGPHLHYQISHPDYKAIDPAPSMCSDYHDGLRQTYRWERSICGGSQ